MMRSSSIIVALFVAVLTTGAAAGAAKSCNCVAFRMDDIQDWWLPQTQIDVIDVFKNTLTPLTALIIGNDFGEDDIILDAVNSYLAYAKTTGWDFEVGCHGWDHVDFSEQTLSKQSSWLAQARTKTVGLLKGTRRLFIGLASSEHLDQLRSWLAAPPYDQLLALEPVVRA